jgi:DNA-binding MarR family transcriptional regulator
VDSSDAEVIATSVLRLARLQRVLYSKDLRDKLQPADLQVLLALWLAPPATVGELAIAAGIEPQSASRSIGRLTARGLVRTAADGSDDRRRRAQRVTPAGRRVVMAFLESAVPLIERHARDSSRSPIL